MLVKRGEKITGGAIAAALIVGATFAMPSTWASDGAGGDAAEGKILFDANCSYCHGMDAGTFKIGPPLGGVYGRKAGTGDYDDYVGLKDMDVVWSEETLDRYLSDPKKFVGGTVGMPASMKDPASRADLIAYLKTL